MVRLIFLSLLSLSALCDEDQQVNFEGFRVMRALPRSDLGQTFLEKEIQRAENDCNVWKQPLK